MLTADKLQPMESADAEEALLGSLLYEPAMLDQVRALKPEHFSLQRNRWIYEAILDLESRGEHIDNLTVGEELKHQGHYEDCGGFAYLTKLMNNTPSFYNAPTYASIIKEAARRREVLKQIERIANSVMRDGTSANTQALLEQTIELLRQPHDDDHLYVDPEMLRYLIPAEKLKDLPPIVWLIVGHVPDNALTVVFGAAGIGKSFFVLDEMALPIAQTDKVLYVATEGEQGYKIRLGAWQKHHTKGYGQLAFYMNTVELLDSKECQKFIALAKLVKPRLLVIDTLANAMLPGDENSTRDMGLFLKAAKEVRHAVNCAVILVHHTGKERNTERGSSALRGAADVMIRLTQDDDQILVECVKSKDAKPFDTYAVKLIEIALETGETSQVVVPAEKVLRSENDPLTRNQQKILDILALESFKDGASNKDIAENTELNPGSVSKALDRLIKRGLVKRSADSIHPYQITEAGMNKVSSYAA